MPTARRRNPRGEAAAAAAEQAAEVEPSSEMSVYVVAMLFSPFVIQTQKGSHEHLLILTRTYSMQEKTYAKKFREIPFIIYIKPQNNTKSETSEKQSKR